eukprot:CAMPEP_0168414496 /NCGR_PEP_ID=MMETSP0228-20121227/29752_1 /TAXON_ID=133427 /ORGANISM="Protoceratium reticulatum, Strain CCCM 535 (=CCMP 1889)" /LENGTH=746 /DNA_ID=CAMNT_0008428287 /DNA_START=146 /DNA_END=2387 /DNA_ORIENTATION=-
MAGNPRCWQEHRDAGLLDVLCQRAVQAGLGEAVSKGVLELSWGREELQSWEALAKEHRERMSDRRQPAEDGADEDDEQRAAERGDEAARRPAGDEEERAKVWAAVHTVRRLGERWPSKRPAQRWLEIRGGKDDSEEVKEEHEDGVVLKVLRLQYMDGGLPEEVYAEMMRLPEVWALDMILTWQAQLHEKMKQIAKKFPDELPASALTDMQGDPARWVRDLRCRACSRWGLTAHVAGELRAWVPWGAEVLDLWRPRMHSDHRGEKKERKPPVERLGQLVAKYPDVAPVKRLYVCNEADHAEQADAVFLEKVSKLHFLGTMDSETILQIAKDRTWLKELLVEWERNRAEGADPEEAMMVKRLREIGERFSLPPTQAAALEKERWSWPHELRIRHVDAWWLRCLKDKFFAHGLSEAVTAAMQAIPVWGAARLEEWRVQKDQRADQIFERSTRPWKKQGQEEGANRRTPGASALTLRDGDRLLRTGKEPRVHKSRVRVDRCHNKTVAEALKSVQSGILILTRKMIAQDIQGGLLRIERASGEDGPATAEPRHRAGAAPERPQALAEERFRSLTGAVVQLDRAALRGPRLKELPQLAELSPGEIEQFAAEDLAHYERQLHWSSKRASTERLEKLARELQTNVLPWAAPAPAAGAEEAAPAAASRPPTFSKLTAYEKLTLRTDELKHLEQQSLIIDGKDLTLQERRERLREHVWKLCGDNGPRREQVFMKQWQSTAASTRIGVTTIEDDDND